MPQDKNHLMQGQADGLCGLYCIINFLSASVTDYRKDYAKYDLWHLLTIFQQFGWLSPQSVYEGFEDYQLKLIFNQHCENRKLSFRAYFLKDYVEYHKLGELSDAAESLTDSSISISQKNAIFAYNTKEDHWVMIHRSDNKLFISDSQLANPRDFEPDKKDDGLCSDPGLIILPKDRQLSGMFS